MRVWKYILRDGPVAGLIRSLSPVYHQKLLMYPRLGYWPHIRDPRSYNEKILYRKLFTNDERFAVVEDKWAVRDYVRKRVDESILPEVYYITQYPKTIPFDSLPKNHVIKPTHMSGPVLFGEDIGQEDQNVVQNLCEKWLQDNYGPIKGEYWYSDIIPRIIIEEDLRARADGPINDYKFYVFDGSVEKIGVYQNRQESSETTATFYDRDWQNLNVVKHLPRGVREPQPKQLDEMLEISETLGADFDHIRVDLYLLNDDEIIFGEMTVAPGSGGNPFTPQSFDFELGEYWEL